MAQYLLPDEEEHGPSGGWNEVGNADGDSWNELNEGFGAGRGSGSGPDDATTYWHSATQWGATLQVKLSEGFDPVANSGYIIRVRAQCVSSDQPFSLELRDNVAGSISGVQTFTAVAAWTTFSYTLTSAQIDLIQNYLGFIFVIRFPNTYGPARFGVSAVELEMPGIPSSAHSFLLLGKLKRGQRG